MSDSPDTPVPVTRINIPPSHRVVSPAFSASYPDIINPHLLEPGARGAMEPTWGTRNFRERSLEVFVLHNVFFSEECLILDDNLRVIENASDVYTDAEITGAARAIERLLSSRILPHYRTGVVSKRRAAGNYGHFLLEMLPMAVLGRQVAVQSDPLYLVHSVEPPLQDAIFRAFRLLGVGLDRLLVKGFHQPAHFEQLIIVRGLTQHGTFMSPLAVQALGTMSESVEPGPYRKVFVRRVPGWNRGRSLVNEREVAARLTERGFHVIEPGGMSLEEQISVFRGADHVVGSLGAAMSNIVFCRRGAKITMLAPGGFPDTFFWFISSHRGLDYTEIRCQPIEQGGREPLQRDFVVTDNDLREIERLDSAVVSLPPTRHDERQSSTHPAVTIMAMNPDGAILRGGLGEWVGDPRSKTPLQGLKIELSRVLEPRHIRYRILLGRDPAGWPKERYSSWISANSPQELLKRGPVLGIIISLHDEVREHFECTYSATFVDGTQKLNCPHRTLCAADSFAALEAVQVSIRARRQLETASGTDCVRVQPDAAGPD